MEYLVSLGVFFLLIISLIQQGLCQAGTYAAGGNAVVAVNAAQPTIPPENAIKCYVCNSKGDPNCSDKQLNKNLIRLVNCADYIYMNDFQKGELERINKTVPNICRKQVQRVSLGSRTDTRVIRSCGYMPQHKRYEWEDDEDFIGDDRCFTRAGTFEVMVTYCSCTKDGCNGGNTIGMTPWMMTLSTIPIVLRFHLPLLLSGHSQ